LKNDTIAAISTPLGEGGIGIVRLSGPDAFDIGFKLFKCTKTDVEKYPEARRLYHGYIKDGSGVKLDEVLVSFMPAPYTYTREDIVEINCHSGIFALRAILSLVLDNGARLAEPGEYTKRAFLNGRIDMSQAEAVIAVIRARSEEAVKMAARTLDGELSGRIKAIRERIIEARAPIEASIDYPEEFNEENNPVESLPKVLKEIKEEICFLLQGVERNRYYQEGVSIAIIGRPNVGKSSLLNAILRQQRAIVHETPGTTRDLIEGYLNMGGYPIRLIDTAGIQGTGDPVELQGIERSRAAAIQAKVLIMVFDGSDNWKDQDQEIVNMKQAEQGLVIVINKKDLKQKISPAIVESVFPGKEIITTTAIRGEGIKQLEEALMRQLDLVFAPALENSIVYSLRHEEILKEALKSIKKTAEIIKDQPLELTSLELQHAWQKLGEITGESLNENLLDRIFSEFCLGK
jgi:tRNA modification GTPase